MITKKQTHLIILSTLAYLAHSWQTFNLISFPFTKTYLHESQFICERPSPCITNYDRILNHRRYAARTHLLLQSTTDSDQDQSKNSIWLARGTILIVAALYGTNYGSIKLMQNSWGGDGAEVLRFALGALCTLPWLYRISKNALIGGLQVGCLNALGYLGQYEALHYTTTSKTAFIASLTVVAVPCFDALTRKSTEYNAFLPAVVAVIGILFLEIDGFTIPNFGDLIALSQPIFFGLGYWRLGSVTKLNPGSAIPLVAAQCIAVFFVTTLHSYINDALPSVSDVISKLQVEPNLCIALIWTGIVTTTVTSVLETRALRIISASDATVLYSTEPLFATLFGYFLLDEEFGGVRSIIGIILVLAACCWNSFSTKA